MVDKVFECLRNRYLNLSTYQCYVKRGSVLAITAVMFVVFAAGCVGQTPSGATVANSNSAYNPTSIDTFLHASEGNQFRFYFQLQDSNHQNTLGDGVLDFKIKDSRGTIVYSKSLNVKASDFVHYQNMLTGNSVGKAFQFFVEQDAIKKGIGTGTADISFSLMNGNVLKASDTYVQIPQYTEDEIKQIYEEQYIKNAEFSGLVVRKGNFEVTLVSYGYFTHLKSYYGGEEVTDFRADIEVKNIGRDSESFSSYDASIVIGSNQYSRSYFSEFDGTNMYPGVIKKGYLVFEGIPTNLAGQAKIITGSSYWFSTDSWQSENYLYSFDIQL